MKALLNRVALVTGGSQGIGEAIAICLAEAGAKVAINYKTGTSRKNAEQVKAAIKALNGIAMVVEADVGNKAEVERMFERIGQVLGDVEILVNNAGVAPFEPFMELQEETWDLTFRTNVKSIFLCSQRAAKAMIPKRYGKIINILSTASLIVTSPIIPHYQSSKAAGHMLTKGMAIELGKFNINVNAVGPSTVDTEMCKDFLADSAIRRAEIEGNPMKRLGTPGQIGDAVVFLASESAMQINGHLLMVDGGISVKAAEPEDHMIRSY